MPVRIVAGGRKGHQHDEDSGRVRALARSRIRLSRHRIDWQRRIPDLQLRCRQRRCGGRHGIRQLMMATVAGGDRGNVIYRAAIGAGHEVKSGATGTAKFGIRRAHMIAIGTGPDRLAQWFYQRNGG